MVKLPVPDLLRHLQVFAHRGQVVALIESPLAFAEFADDLPLYIGARTLAHPTTTKGNKSAPVESRLCQRHDSPLGDLATRGPRQFVNDEQMLRVQLR